MTQPASTPVPLYMRVFPDYDDELIIPEGWEDTSWGNDCCPSICRIPNADFQVYQDYKDPKLREPHLLEAPRYGIQNPQTGEQFPMVDTWEEVLQIIADFDAKKKVEGA